MTKLTIQLPAKAYDLVFDAVGMANLGAYVAGVWSPRQVAVITDTKVGPLYAQMVKSSLLAAGFNVTVLTLPAGEGTKSLTTLGQVSQTLAQHGFTRADGIVALGGGVIGDLAGLVAALYMRGISFIQVPTSLTAQVDASVGGKTAVNLTQTKNVLGAFYQPDFVLIDPTFLDTLTDRDLVEGYGEVVKVSALAGGDFFDQTGKIQTVADLRQQAAALTVASIGYKAEVVMADEKEAGRRQVLNFGHTIGHAIELEAKGKLRHGEAVAVGMVAITRYFEHVGISAPGLTEALAERLMAVGLPLRSSLMGKPAFFDHLVNDKKQRGGKINLVALSKPGQPRILTKELTAFPNIIKTIQTLEGGATAE